MDYKHACKIKYTSNITYISMKYKLIQIYAILACDVIVEILFFREKDGKNDKCLNNNNSSSILDLKNEI